MFTRLTLFLSIFLLLLAACDEAPAPASSPQPAATQAGVQQPGVAAAEATALPQPTATPIPPSPTPAEPLAATVNGEPVYLSAYEAALARQEQGQALVLPGGVVTSEEADLDTQVLDMLIEQALIEQFAQEQGIVVTPQMVEEELNALRQQGTETGGEGSFEQWLAANQWTEETFREALAYQMLVGQVSTVVTADVPEGVPQVHARYLQVDDPALAQSLHDQLVDENNPADFAALAQEYSLDRSTAEEGGDLGYFPRGTLLVPEIEEAAFSLEPGQVGEVISATTPGGDQPVYYLVQVEDVDSQRPLSPELRAIMLQERFEQWLAEQWAQAEIVRFVDD